MILRESVSYYNRFINDETSNFIGRCVNGIMYWYKNHNGDLIKKDTCVSINKYYL